MATTNNQKRSRKMTTFTLPEEAREKLRRKSDSTGISQSRILEKLIQEMVSNNDLERKILRAISEEDFQNWCTSHNRQYERPDDGGQPERGVTEPVLFNSTDEEELNQLWKLGKEMFSR